ncbi:MAG: hypothetical protein Q9166_001110 [cf. Caloplaca sp. 2 TL-2023]
MLSISIPFFLSIFTAAETASATDISVGIEVKVALNSRSANIHLSQQHNWVHPFTVTYGACHTSGGRHEIHHNISEVHHQRTDRLIWLLPEVVSSGGCLSAWDSQSKLIGRSPALEINKQSKQWIKNRHLEKGTRLGKRASIPMNNASGIDANGPWFDGVELLKEKEITTVDVAQAKAKRMAGLMTWLCLNMSGFTNLEIVEAGQRLGGRVHTAYLEGGPSDYQYQEMGPMRFPESIQYAGSDETIPINDMRLVFQLVDIMNQLNKGQSNYTVKFIPWIQESPNGLYYFSGLKKANGLPPTATEVKNDPNLTIEIPADPIVGNITDLVSEIGCNPETMGAVAKNVFTAYKSFIDTGLEGLGGDDWSEYAYIHNHLMYSLNATDLAVNAGRPSLIGLQGLNQLPNSFYPHVGSITTMGRSIERAQSLPESNQVTLSWKDNYTDTTYRNKTYDYAIISAPFSKVRSWRFLNTSK